MADIVMQIEFTAQAEVTKAPTNSTTEQEEAK